MIPNWLTTRWAKFRSALRNLVIAAGAAVVALSLGTDADVDGVLSALTALADNAEALAGSVAVVVAAIWSWNTKDKKIGHGDPPIEATSKPVQSHVLTGLMALAIALVLSGCDAVRKIAPQTAAGFETNGILGALDGASGAILARCQMADGSVVRGAVDVSAAGLRAVQTLETIRRERQRLCNQIGAVKLLGEVAAAAIRPQPPPGSN